MTTVTFCTTLRWRASFSPGIPSLTTAGFRESRLDTHDVQVPLSVARRQMRILLLAPSSVEAGKLDATFDRVQHFVSLTGGQDLAIGFLLQPPTTSFTSAKQLVNGPSTCDDSSGNGMRAYTSLLALLTDRTDIPYVPILPVATLESLPSLLRKHAVGLSEQQPLKPTAKPPSPFDMLQLCTANPPMPQQTAHILSDLFPDLHELAAACTGISSAPASSSPSARAAAGLSISSQDTDMLDVSTQESMAGAGGKLKALRDLVGQQQCVDVVDFWREEWTME